ncbi:MAG TPA: DUF4157 domain-containing protein [Rhodothermia bacterium]|nr:DUF4157 domain-containing protein [Rhodothermia bacterium]
MGNQTIQRLLEARTGIQPKLTVSAPGDIYEREADRVADAVIAGNSPAMGPISQNVQPMLSRMFARPEDKYDSVTPPEGESATDSSEGSPAEEEVQRCAIGEAGAVTGRFEQSLQAVQGSGETLSAATDSFMGTRFDRDFSSVRVHSDARSDTLAKGVNARAFTLGNDIFFARSQYQPESRDGRRLLAHELTHVVQQSQGRLSRQIQRQTSCSSYPGYDSSIHLHSYNCAGLALRTYNNIAPSSAVPTAISANFINPTTPARRSCSAGKVKFWLWDYDVHTEDDQGNIVDPAWQDFHVVAGRTGRNGRNPTNVYSKNGRRPVYGPGTGPSFRPPTRERATRNHQNETPLDAPNGGPLIKVRSNMSESLTCAGCYP